MKKLHLLAVGLGLWLLIPSVSAQVIVGSTNIADRVGRIIFPDRILRDTPSGLAFGLRPPRVNSDGAGVCLKRSRMTP